jgi:MYXO-CTERM domain-containing protein
MTGSTLRITAVAVALLAAMPVLAQETTDDAAATDTVTVADTDNDMDWGWIGLLGLLGLAGLARRRPEVTTVHTTTPHR